MYNLVRILLWFFNKFYIFGWRQVPVKAKVLGIKANDTRPEIEQILFSPIKKTGSEELEKNIYDAIN